MSFKKAWNGASKNVVYVTGIQCDNCEKYIKGNTTHPAVDPLCENAELFYDRYSWMMQFCPMISNMSNV